MKTIHRTCINMAEYHDAPYPPPIARTLGGTIGGLVFSTIGYMLYDMSKWTKGYHYADSSASINDYDASTRHSTNYQQMATVVIAATIVGALLPSVPGMYRSISKKCTLHLFGNTIAKSDEESLIADNSSTDSNHIAAVKK